MQKQNAPGLFGNCHSPKPCPGGLPWYYVSELGNLQSGSQRAGAGIGAGNGDALQEVLGVIHAYRHVTRIRYEVQVFANTVAIPAENNRLPTRQTLFRKNSIPSAVPGGHRPHNEQVPRGVGTRRGRYHPIDLPVRAVNRERQ